MPRQLTPSAKTFRSVLTRHERLILKLVSMGCTNKDIANRLFISLDTVKKHLQNIYRKLDAKNKIEALRKAGMM